MLTMIAELKALLNEQVIPDVEDEMDQIFAMIANNAASQEDKEDLDELRLFKVELDEIVKELEDNQLDEAEAKELYEEIKTLQKMSDEELA